jgi:hypothetical protein
MGIVTTRRKALLALIGLGASVGLVAASGAADAIGGNCTKTGNTVSCTYIYAGAEQQFVIPAGVTALQISATGGSGDDITDGAKGGRGAVVSGPYAVPVGVSVLYVEVGGSSDPNCVAGRQCSGGYNGGGTAYYAGAGGGASDVRTTPASAGLDPSFGDATLNSRVIVAGGGGGAGGEQTLCPAGDGGPGAGMGGNGTVCQGTLAGTGGGAGTQTAGGPGGFGDSEGGQGPPQADSGTYGRGGAGGGNQGGGGGGGLYGGGGGGNYRYDTSTGGAGGGGGGSNLVPSGGTVGPDGSGIAQVVISYQDTTTPPGGTAPTIGGQPPAADVHQPYSYTFTTSGTPSPAVSKSSGTLPPGLSLSGGGTLSGTPTQAGSYAFTVIATNPSGSASENVRMTVRGMPVIRIAGGNTQEGNSGTHPLAFRVTLSHSATQPVTVRYATATSSATSPSDFAATSGTLTFSPGQTTKTVGVAVRGDRVKEKNEVFFVLLSRPTQATIGTSAGTGGILDDD